MSDIVDLGDELRCPCPLHNGDNKTGFVWHKTKGLWFCFTHKCGGKLKNKHDLYEFVSLKLGISFTDAAEQIAQKYGFNLEKDTGVNNFSQLLETNNFIKNKITQSKYRVNELKELDQLPGYSEKHFETVLKYLETRDYNYEDVAKFNLYPMLDSFNLVRLGIPVYDEFGKLVGVNGRLMDTVLDYPEEITLYGKTYPVPKYKMNSFDKGSVLYNLNNARKQSLKEGLIVVEGQLDVIRLHTFGIYNAVCTMGTNLSAAQTSLLYRNAFKVTFLVEEGEAARKGVQSSIKKIQAAMKICIAELPSGDADSNSPETVKETLKNSRELSRQEIVDLSQGRIAL